MEQLPNGITLDICQGGFPLSTDSMLLSGFAKVPKQAKVLDLGSGCGTLGLLLCANHPTCAVTGVELEQRAHETALQNISRNGLADRMQSICADLATVPNFLAPGSFTCCISNPPYFTAGPASAQVPLARREDACSLQTLFRSAAWAVKYGGDFFLVHRPERLSEIFVRATQASLEPKRLCTVRHRPGDTIDLVLVQCRKGAKPGLVWEELCLFEADGSPSAQYRSLYHL